MLEVATNTNGGIIKDLERIWHLPEQAQCEADPDLIQIGKHQPALNQKAGQADPQAISEYLQGLKECNYRLISQTKELQDLVKYIDWEILCETEIESDVVTNHISEGKLVTLSMRESQLHATPGEIETATAVTSTDPGRAVGDTNVGSILDYELWTVWMVMIPMMRFERCDELELNRITTIWIEAAVAARVIGVETKMGPRVPKAAMKELNVIVLAVADESKQLIEQLHQNSVSCGLVNRAEL